MADRSCGVYFLNYTPFQLRRQSYQLEHGSWDVEPPETIGAKAKTAREPNVFAWKAVATGAYLAQKVSWSMPSRTGSRMCF